MYKHKFPKNQLFHNKKINQSFIKIRKTLAFGQERSFICSYSWTQPYFMAYEPAVYYSKEYLANFETYVPPGMCKCSLQLYPTVSSLVYYTKKPPLTYLTVADVRQTTARVWLLYFFYSWASMPDKENLTEALLVEAKLLGAYVNMFHCQLLVLDSVADISAFSVPRYVTTDSLKCSSKKKKKKRSTNWNERAVSYWYFL